MIHRDDVSSAVTGLKLLGLYGVASTSVPPYFPEVMFSTCASGDTSPSNGGSAFPVALAFPGLQALHPPIANRPMTRPMMPIVLFKGIPPGANPSHFRSVVFLTI